MPSQGQCLPRNKYKAGCRCCCGDLSSFFLSFVFDIPFDFISNTAVLKKDLLDWYKANISPDVISVTVTKGSVIADFKSEGNKKIEEIFEKGNHYDANGLKLRVDKNLNKNWIVRYQIDGKTREIGLGKHPFISLKDARQKLFNIKNLILRNF